MCTCIYLSDVLILCKIVLQQYCLTTVVLHQSCFYNVCIYIYTDFTLTHHQHSHLVSYTTHPSYTQHLFHLFLIHISKQINLQVNSAYPSHVSTTHLFHNHITHIEYTVLKHADVRSTSH